jgi:hypothetical protein
MITAPPTAAPFPRRTTTASVAAAGSANAALARWPASARRVSAHDGLGAILPNRGVQRVLPMDDQRGTRREVGRSMGGQGARPGDSPIARREEWAMKVNEHCRQSQWSFIIGRAGGGVWWSPGFGGLL